MMVIIFFTCFLCSIFIFFYFTFIKQAEHTIDISNKYKSNNVSVCLFLPSAVDDFPFVQSIITSVDTFWPKGIGRKIHWIDNYNGTLPFNYSDEWTVIRTSTPDIKLPVMKQQYNSYASYKYCSTDEFIAMIDSDSPFISYAKYDMLFNTNRRPYILYTVNYRDYRWDPTKILKSNNSDWGDVMFTYPIIVKTKHVKETWNYIEKVHNSTLVELMEKYIFGQFGTFLEYINIMKYENQYSLINIEKNPFPPRCTIHIPYSFIEVNYGKTEKINVQKHRDVIAMNKLINYLIRQGKCAENRKNCNDFDEEKFKKNSYTIEAKYKHYFSNLVGEIK